MTAGCLEPALSRPSEPAPVFVNMTVPFAPVPVLGPEGMVLAYELEIPPSGYEPWDLDAVEVLDPDTGVVLWSPDATLLSKLYHPISRPPPTMEESWNGTGKISTPRISLWFSVEPGSVPGRLVHRLTLNRSASGLPPATVIGGLVDVRRDLRPVVVGLPVRGQGWMATETTAPETHHFLSQITLHGITHVPQRYAQDFTFLDPRTGHAATGNATLATSFYGYGKEVFAVSHGSVVSARDDLPDLETIYSAPLPTAETAAGNYLILDIGDRKYACYAHFAPGSLRAGTGDFVTEGQVIGVVGNSGNSDLPHLHFQVVTENPSFLGAEGYPHVYRSFTMTGIMNETLLGKKAIEPNFTLEQLWKEFGDCISPFDQPVRCHGVLPGNGAVISSQAP